MRTLLSVAILALCALPAGADEFYQHGSTAADAYEMAAQIDAGVYHGDYYEGVGCGDSCGGCGDACGCDPCGDACGHHGCGLFGHGCKGCKKTRRRFENLWENCNCNGSYKFPVPPLYTYHWPGLYSWQLMTDYQSPYRFPAIRPYTEENLPEVEDVIAPASFTTGHRASGRVAPTQRGGVESIADKMRRHYGN